MLKEDKKELRKYIFLAIVILLVILSYLMIKSSLIPLLSSFILAYLTKPLYDRLSKKIPKSLSAIICILIVIILVVLPSSLIISNIINQSRGALSVNNLSPILEKISSNEFIQNIGLDLESLKDKGIAILISLIGSTAAYLPLLIFSIFIALFSMYFILVYWDSLVSQLKDLLPFDNKEKISREIDSATRGMIHGILLVAIIEFFVALIGFYISGVEAYFLFATLVFILAFIPGLGPAFVWVPTLIYYLITSNYYTAIGVLIIGLIITIFFDTFLINKLTSKAAKINPVIMLLGVVGGISVFGIFGFIIGPLVLYYTIKLVQESIKEYGS